jgi:hypothetical protein
MVPAGGANAEGWLAFRDVLARIEAYTSRTAPVQVSTPVCVNHDGSSKVKSQHHMLVKPVKGAAHDGNAEPFLSGLLSGIEPAFMNLQELPNLPAIAAEVTS